MKNNLKFFRERAGYTQDQVASKVSVTKLTVSRHENGVQSFEKHRSKYAELFGVSELQLISDIQPEQGGAQALTVKEPDFTLDENIVFAVQDLVSERLRANNTEIPAQNFSEEVRRLARHTIEKMKLMKSDLPTASLIDHILELDKAGKL